MKRLISIQSFREKILGTDGLEFNRKDNESSVYYAYQAMLVSIEQFDLVLVLVLATIFSSVNALHYCVRVII